MDYCNLLYSSIMITDGLITRFLWKVLMKDESDVLQPGKRVYNGLKRSTLPFVDIEIAMHNMIF